MSRHYDIILGHGTSVTLLEFSQFCFLLVQELCKYFACYCLLIDTCSLFFFFFFFFFCATLLRRFDNCLDFTFCCALVVYVEYYCAVVSK